MTEYKVLTEYDLYHMFKPLFCSFLFLLHYILKIVLLAIHLITMWCYNYNYKVTQQYVSCSNHLKHWNTIK